MKKLVSLIFVILLVCSNHLSPLAANNGQPNLKSKGAILLDSDTGAVLYQKMQMKRCTLQV